MTSPPERRARSRRREDLERDRLFTLSLDILCVCGFDGVFRQVNPAFERVLGYEASTLTSRPFLEFVVPEDRDTTRAQFAQVIEGGFAISFENRWLHRDGSVRWLQWSGSPDVEHEAVYATAHDVTDRRRAQEGLALLASIVASSDDAIIGMGLDGTITSWNPAAEELFGWSADEALGRAMTMLIPSGHSSHLEQILDAIRRGQKVTHYETFRRRKDGTVLGVSLSVSPVHGADGAILGASSILRDVTERRQAEAERLNLLQQLEHALTRAKRMTGSLHFCEVCRRVRDERGFWTDIVQYIDDHADARPVPGRCPDHAEEPEGLG